MAKQLFRKSVLEKQDAPEQIDQPLELEPRRTKQVAFVFALLLIGAGIWSIFGYVPVVATGQGVLMTPRSLVQVQSASEGQLMSWSVKVGDSVHKGDSLGVLQFVEIERQLASENGKLADLLTGREKLIKLREAYNSFEYDALEKKRQSLIERIDELREQLDKSTESTEKIHGASLAVLEKQKFNTERSLELNKQCAQLLKGRVDSFERLLQQKHASIDSVQNVKRQFGDMESQVRDQEYQRQFLNVRESEVTQSYLNAKRIITDREAILTQLQLQMRELDSRVADLKQSENQASADDNNQEQQIRRSIQRLEERLKWRREITSPVDGRVLELSAIEGSIIRLGQAVVQLDSRDSDDALVAIAFFDDTVGEYLKESMDALVSPISWDKNEYGSIRGKVESSSDYPVTAEAVANIVGNKDLAVNLTANGHHNQLMIKLEKSDRTPSQYSWTTIKGPEEKLTAGTTAFVTIIYERRRPISYVIPTVRSWLGI